MTEERKPSGTPEQPQTSKFQKLDEASKKIKGKVEQVKKSIQAVDWKAKFLFALQTLILLSIVALHGYSTIDNFRLATNLKFVCLATAFITLLSSYKLFRVFGPGHAAVFGFSLFILPIAISAISFGGPNDNGFMLANQGTGFWASATCLGTILVMGSWLYTREIPSFLKHLFAIPLLYCSLGFLVGMFQGAPLDLVVLGTGFLQSIPFIAQPASLYLNLVLPVFLGIISLLGLSSIFRGEREKIPGLTAVGLFFLLPFVMGITTMNRYLIPNISFLVMGKPVGIGYTKLSYSSSWDAKDNGSHDHEIEVQTKDFKPEKEPNYEMNASLVPSSGFGQKTKITLSVKDKKRGNDILNLVAKDFLVFEDGKKQDHTLDVLLDRKSLKTMIVLCLDFSGSMSSAQKDLRSAAKSFVENMRTGYEVELITFAGNVYLTTNGFTGDQKTLLAAIDGLNAGGGTPMYDAVTQAFVDLEKHPEARGIVVVFSDGADTGSRNSREATFDRVKDKGIILFAIGLGDELVQSGGDKVMMKMAGLTGGKYFFVKDAGDLSKTFAQVLDFISCQYNLQYEKELPPPPMIHLTDPKQGAEFSKPFSIRADVKGKTQQVDFFLDGVPIKSFTEKREGIFEFSGENPDDYDAGKHVIMARVKDAFGRVAEDKMEVSFKRQLPQISILEPAEGSVVWKDGSFKAGVKGQFVKEVIFLVDGKPIKTFSGKSQIFCEPFSFKSFGEGLHVFKVQAIMTDGRKTEVSSSFKVIIPRPSVKIISPGDKTQIFGEVPVMIEADSGLQDASLLWVKLFLDGNEFQQFQGKPFKKIWNTDTASEGEHILKAVAQNECGEVSEHSISVTAIKPKFFVSFSGIDPGQVLRTKTSGKLLVVNEQPSTTIEKIELFIDGKPFQTLKSPPWEFFIDVLKFPEGEHELRAETYRSDGKIFTSSIRFVVHPPKKVVLYFSVRDE
ncbi:VWA domain-containing protein, partial [bacterium]|nr:VWA domain-containing protein [bacterium]